jgi:hypothetical protein
LHGNSDPPGGEEQMIKDMRRALEKKGYTVDEIELLLNSFAELLGKLRKEAKSNLVASA